MPALITDALDLAFGLAMAVVSIERFVTTFAFLMPSLGPAPLGPAPL